MLVILVLTVVLCYGASNASAQKLNDYETLLEEISEVEVECERITGESAS